MSRGRQRQRLVAVEKETRGVSHLLACRSHLQSHPRHCYCSLRLASDASLLLGVYRPLCLHHLPHPHLRSPSCLLGLKKEALRPAPKQGSCGRNLSCVLSTLRDLKIRHDSDHIRVRP